MRKYLQYSLASCFFIVCLVGIRSLYAADPKIDYDVENIPDELLENANAVMRTDKGSVEILNEEKGEITRTWAVTILNKNGSSHNTLVAYYHDEFNKVSQISGVLYDAKGKIVRKLKPKEIRDFSVSGGDDGVGDYRAKVAELNYNEYPYTVEFSYTTNYKGSIFLPNWQFQRGTKLAVQKSQFSVTSDKSFGWNYKVYNGAPEPSITENDEIRIVSWDMEELAATKYEPYSPEIDVPFILTSPTKIVWDGYVGDSKTWQEFGQFSYELNKGRQNLPDELKEKVHQMTSGASTVMEKIDTLYKYMQENTRYVSIQLGIGGWQTFDPEYVYRNGYGDCKALSNYLHSMLKEVGVPSHTVLVQAGGDENDIKPEFVGDQFNHVILVVPNDGDSVWVECTSSENPAGYLGRFTQDRHVLVTKDGESKLVKTPTAYPEDNLQKRSADINLKSDGTAEAKVYTRYTGYQQDRIRQGVRELNDRDMEKWLKQRIYIPSYDLNSYDWEEITENILPTYDLNYEVFARKWASASGTRIFLAPNVLNPKTDVPEKMDDRTQPIALDYPYLDTDTLTYHLPEGYSIESMPEMPVKIETVFGEYEANIVMKDPTTLVYSRKLKMEKIELPAKSYNAFREFKKAVSKADRLQIVLNGKS